MMCGLLQAKRVFAVAVLLYMVAVAHAQPVLSWSTNTAENLKGYRVYFLDNSTAYDPIDVGLATTHTLTNLLDLSYMVFVTAYNTSGQESDPSTVLAYPETEDCRTLPYPSGMYLG